MVYTTYFWWFGGLFIIVLSKLYPIAYSLQLLFLELDEHVSSYSILLVQLQDVEENLSVPSVLGMFIWRHTNFCHICWCYFGALCWCPLLVQKGISQYSCIDMYVNCSFRFMFILIFMWIEIIFLGTTHNTQIFFRCYLHLQNFFDTGHLAEM